MKGISQTYTCIHSPPNSPPAQDALLINSVFICFDHGLSPPAGMRGMGLVNIHHFLCIAVTLEPRTHPRPQRIHEWMDW